MAKSNNNDLLLLAGAGVLAYFFLKPKTTVPLQTALPVNVNKNGQSLLQAQNPGIVSTIIKEVPNIIDTISNIFNPPSLNQSAVIDPVNVQISVPADGQNLHQLMVLDQV